jgi:predicted metal-dependent hydrolase
MQINGIDIAIERKPIKNLHLAVYPPDARVHVSMPDYLSEDDARSFIISRWDWVERQREQILNQARQSEREFVSGESHYCLGTRYRLRVIEMPRCAHTVNKQGEWLMMNVQPGTTTEKREEVLREWLRGQLKDYLQEIVPYWTKRINEDDVTWEVKQMRTQWGSCITKKRHLIFNLELARVPRECIEYVVVHELTHLMVKNHNKMFEMLMSQRLPLWRSRRKQLNDFIALPMDEWAAGGAVAEK